jgi:uncharacterized protein YjbJ (UPF0337 family)
MNLINIKGCWNEMIGKIKKKYAYMTDNELLFREGKEVESLGRLQKKFVKSQGMNSVYMKY